MRRGCVPGAARPTEPRYSRQDSCCVNEQRTLFHESQLPFADHVRRLPGERNDEKPRRPARQELRQLFTPKTPSRVCGRCGQLDQMGWRRASIAWPMLVADRWDALAVKFFAEDVRVGALHRRVEERSSAPEPPCGDPDAGMPQIVETTEKYLPRREWATVHSALDGMDGRAHRREPRWEG